MFIGQNFLYNHRKYALCDVIKLNHKKDLETLSMIMSRKKFDKRKFYTFQQLLVFAFWLENYLYLDQLVIQLIVKKEVTICADISCILFFKQPPLHDDGVINNSSSGFNVLYQCYSSATPPMVLGYF